MFNIGKTVQTADIEAVIELQTQQGMRECEEDSQQTESEDKSCGIELEPIEERKTEKDGDTKTRGEEKPNKGRRKQGSQERTKKRRKKRKKNKEKKKEMEPLRNSFEDKYSDKIHKLERSLNDSIHAEEEYEEKGKEKEGEEEREQEESWDMGEYEEDESMYEEEEEEDFRWGGLSLSGRESEYFENEGDTYSILTTQDVYEIMQAKAKEAGEIFELPTSTAVQVLSRIQWNVSRIAEAESVESFLSECGVNPDPSPPLTGSQHCCVCFDEDLEVGDVFCLGCSHTCCRECWLINISNALNNYRPNEINCPGKDCHFCLLDSDVLLLGGEKEYTRYKEQIVETFIQNNHRMLYCNDPKCNLITEYRGWLQANSQIKCNCGAIFCFRCCKEKLTETGEGHFPATCKQFSRWLEKSEGGVYTFRKKPCPKCKSAIIKCGCPANEVICSEKEYCPNQACNHMQCPMCGHHFCWVCLKNWSGHDDFYNCSFVVPEMVKHGQLQGEYLQAYLKYKDSKENSMVFQYRCQAFKKIFGLLPSSSPSSFSASSSSSSTSSSASSSSPSSSPLYPSSFSSLVQSVSNIEGIQENFLSALEELAFCYHTLSNTYVMLYYAKEVKEGAPSGAELDSNQVQLFEYKQAVLANLIQQFATKMDDVLKSTFSKTNSDQKQLKGFSDASVQEFTSLTQIVQDYRLKLFSDEN